MFRPGMRGYLVPLAAGVALTISAFLPWVIIGEVSTRGVPDLWAMWVAGLGAIAAKILHTRRKSPPKDDTQKANAGPVARSGTVPAKPA